MNDNLEPDSSSPTFLIKHIKCNHKTLNKIKETVNKCSHGGEEEIKGHKQVITKIQVWGFFFFSI